MERGKKFITQEGTIGRLDKEKIRRLASNEVARRILKNAILTKAIIETGRNLMSLVSLTKNIDLKSLVECASDMSGLESGLEQLSALKDNIERNSPHERIDTDISEQVLETCFEIWEAIEREEIDFSMYFRKSSHYEDIVGFVLDEEKPPDYSFSGFDGFDGFK